MESSQDEPVHDAKVDLCSLPVDSLVIYQTRATLSRPFSVSCSQLAAGKRKITVAGFLQEKTIEESIKITADADTLNAVILEQTTRYYTIEIDEKKDIEEDKPLVDEIDKLQESINDLTKQIQRNNSEKSDFSEALTKRNKCTSGKRGLDYLLAQEQWNALENTLSELSSRVEAHDVKASELRDKARDLLLTTQEIEKQLSERRNERQKKREEQKYKQQVFDVTLVIDVFEQNTVEAKFQIDYAVRDCSWTPTYDLRIEKSDKEVELVFEQEVPQEEKKRKKNIIPPPAPRQNNTQDFVNLDLSCYASIKQHSGEDWRSAKEMKLCTIDPSIEAKAPTLEKQIVYFTLQPRSIGSRVRGLFSGLGFGSTKRTIEDDLHFAKKEAEKSLSAQEVPDSVVSNGNGSIVHHFDITGNSVDVPSDALEHRVLLFKRTISNCVRSHYCAPKLTQDAFVKVTCEESDVDVPLLPGAVQVFDGKNYVCNAELNRAVNPRESFELYLGVNTNVRVQYLPVKRKESITSNMLGYSKQNHCVVSRVVLIRNAQANATEITVADQLPKSVEHVIVVKLVKPESLATSLETQHQQTVEKKKGEPYLNDKNNIQWDNIHLGPGEDLRLEFTYSVEWPVDKHLNSADL